MLILNRARARSWGLTPGSLPAVTLLYEAQGQALGTSEQHQLGQACSTSRKVFVGVMHGSVLSIGDTDLLMPQELPSTGSCQQRGAPQNVPACSLCRRLTLCFSLAGVQLCHGELAKERALRHEQRTEPTAHREASQRDR